MDLVNNKQDKNINDKKRRGALKVDIITLFPEVFPGVLGHSLLGKALERGIWSLRCHNLREFAEGKHLSVDDTPAGGGSGMVIRADIGLKAIRKVKESNQFSKLICLSPRGKTFDQKMARSLALEDGLILLCGRYEGFDERIFELEDIEEVSIGDYVLAGGEAAAQTILEAVLRLLPDVLGDSNSHIEESFENGLLEYPQYTRPRDVEGKAISEILLNGDHEKIRKWRLQKSLELTKLRRPDLYEEYMKNEKTS